MTLAVLERLLLLNLLPPEGDITTVRVVHRLRQDLSFSEEELGALHLRTVEDEIKWEPEADPLKDVPVGAKAREVIGKLLTRLSKSEKLTEQHLALYEKFVGNDDDAA